MSLFEITLTASTLVVFVALYAARRRPDRKGRYLLVAVVMVTGLFLGLWTLAKGLCCY
jgi:hypothetical protein